jgi:predicted 3-demethylubiquinone-9 3-methyltransferase (glyoxalase superfamily)
VLGGVHSERARLQPRIRGPSLDKELLKTWRCGRSTSTEALSLAVNCESQKEVDYLWTALSEGGEEGPCGWLKDRYGLSWQIMPVRLTELLNDPDEAAAQRVMSAMLQMTKIDIAELERAHAAGA